jgi:hypothetical protein
LRRGQLAALAALLMLATVVFAVVPVWSDVSAGGEPGPRLSCGSLFFPSKLSFTDACEDARVPRIMATLAVWTAGLVLGTVGLGVLYRAVRHL